MGHTPIPWTHVRLVGEDGNDMTADEVGEYVAKTFKKGTREEFHAIQAEKEDGIVYDVCHVGNGPDSPWNAAAIVKAVNYHERLAEALWEMVEDPDDVNVKAYARTILKELEGTK